MKILYLKCKCKCGKTFKPRQSSVKDPKRGKYCSRKCVYKNQNHIGETFHSRKGRSHWNYKGKSAKYAALHLRVQGRRGKASVCEDCGANDNVEWANLTGKYADVLDYKSLCRKCHHKLDHHNVKRAKTLGKKRLSEIASKGWETRRFLDSKGVVFR